MAEMGSRVGMEPWPPLDWATWIFDRASFVLIGSLILGAIATVTIVWMGIAKEHHWDLARERAGKQIGELFKSGEQLSKEAEQLRKDTAQANERAAEATLKANEADLARVKLEKKLAPRWLWPEQQDIIRKKLVRFSGMVAHFWVYPVGTADIAPLSMLLLGVLHNAGWETASWTSLGGYPSVGGVTITWRDGSEINKEAAQALVQALREAEIDAIAPGPFEKDDNNFAPPAVPAIASLANIKINPPTIRIFVGTKP